MKFRPMSRLLRVGEPLLVILCQGHPDIIQSINVSLLFSHGEPLLFCVEYIIKPQQMIYHLENNCNPVSEKNYDPVSKTTMILRKINFGSVSKFNYGRS